MEYMQNKYPKNMKGIFCLLLFIYMTAILVNNFKIVFEILIFFVNLFLAISLFHYYSNIKQKQVRKSSIAFSLISSIICLIVAFINNDFILRSMLYILYLNILLFTFATLYNRDDMENIIRKAFIITCIVFLFTLLFRVLKIDFIGYKALPILYLWSCFLLLYYSISYIKGISRSKGNYLVALCISTLLGIIIGNVAPFIFIYIIVIIANLMNSYQCKLKKIFIVLFYNIILMSLGLLMLNYNILNGIKFMMNEISFVSIISVSLFLCLVIIKWMSDKQHKSVLYSVLIFFDIMCIFYISFYDTSYTMLFIIAFINSLIYIKNGKHEENKKFNLLMRQYSSEITPLNLSEIKSITLEMLEIIHKKCEEHNLRYYLAGGTLLGAIRHKGFIPWDDDLDISMPRKDFLKFRDIINEDATLKHFHCFSAEDEGYMYSFMKLVNTDTIIIESNTNYEYNGNGIFIDIFPIDGLGNDRERAIKRIKLYAKLSNFLLASIHPYFIRRKNIVIKGIMMIKGVICEFLGPRIINTLIYKFTQRYDFDESQYIASAIAGRGGIKELLEQKTFATTVDIEFENKYFKGPSGWKEYLTNLYGDYMQLPPIDQRETDHSFHGYWKKNIIEAIEKGEKL